MPFVQNAKQTLHRWSDRICSDVQGPAARHAPSTVGYHDAVHKVKHKKESRAKCFSPKLGNDVFVFSCGLREPHALLGLLMTAVSDMKNK